MQSILQFIIQHAIHRSGYFQPVEVWARSIALQLC